eukprot:CAMPEP_0174714548 /NCGR_PEP_ID=MMETSP1094-20130205/18577_1 /TAXON_ID=156173 /ORGANISM="Chrysochromulina brevifilum, Strain UTEX LB 985" /LENGTH=148 /DNA_ID=CAMNT_0015913931 /DNA_START=35 /DNA_END=484 /DNA_ORIENTATION=+
MAVDVLAVLTVIIIGSAVLLPQGGAMAKVTLQKKQNLVCWTLVQEGGVRHSSPRGHGHHPGRLESERGAYWCLFPSPALIDSDGNDAAYPPETAQTSPIIATTEAKAKIAAAGGLGSAHDGPIDKGCRVGRPQLQPRRLRPLLGPRSC